VLSIGEMQFDRWLVIFRATVGHKLLAREKAKHINTAAP
jgi:hypothetical protein